MPENYTVNEELENPQGISVKGTEESDFKYDEKMVKPTDSLTIDTPAPDAGPSMSLDVENDNTPTTTINGENDTTPVMSVDGMAENPNYSYDEKKGESAAPITIDGNVSTDTPAEANAPTQAPAKDKDFSAGFKFSKEARDKVAANNKNASFWGAGGIMDQFLNSKTPEDAFQGLFINMLLYLPAVAVKMAEMKKAEIAERNKYIKEKRNAYEEQIAQMKGLGGTDRLRALHQDFIKTGGDMSALAAQIREKDPKLLKDLGIEFDEKGMAKNIDKKKEEALAKAFFTERYKELYNGILPSKDKLDEMWKTCKVMKESGMYEQLQSQQKQAEQKEVPAATITENVPVQDTTPTLTQDTAKTQDVQKTNVSELSFNPAALGVHSFEAAKEKMLTIDGKPLAERAPMNLKDAHETSLSVTTPTTLKADLSAYSATVSGLKGQEKQVGNDRSALTAARNMKFNLTENTNALNVRVGNERA